LHTPLAQLLPSALQPLRHAPSGAQNLPDAHVSAPDESHSVQVLAGVQMPGAQFAFDLHPGLQVKVSTSQYVLSAQSSFTPERHSTQTCAGEQ
jgi:hypothetical protein